MYLHYQYAVSYVSNIEGEGDIEQQNQVNNQPPEEVNNQPPEEGNNQQLEEGVNMETQAMRAEYCQLCIF